MKLALTNFSLKHPWVVIVAVLAVTLAFASQFPKVKFDNDPENMLASDEPVRVFHNLVKDTYSLYDFVIVGIVNDKHPDGVFNVGTLNRIHELTYQLLSLKQGDDGKPVVASHDGTEMAVDLTPGGAWNRILNTAFKHDPNRLFDDDGNSAIITREIISPSVVDNIKQADLGSLKMEYLMETPPTSREEALVLRDDAMGTPLYNGTLVSEDEKAICVYIPIQNKTYSYNVAALVQELTDKWDGDDRVFITGQPVAQDTFGVEMLVQMAISAPLAGLAIFLLLWFFFKRLTLITAPMIVAVVSVLSTMGLLIGSGHDVHIMSSMIAIFLMPIAVADSVHILSEFFDLYHKFSDKAQTLRHVVGHLFRPMLYTSLTTIAGFASLALTPIPPVQIFGLHVAFGIALAWVLTMTLIPAYIMVAVPARSLEAMGRKPADDRSDRGMLSGFLGGVGSFTYKRWKLTLVATVIVLLISAYGIGRIRVNDNPVKWFTRSHPIRVADEVLNSHFGGTYTAYLTLTPGNTNGLSSEMFLDHFSEASREKLSDADAKQVATAIQNIRGSAKADKSYTPAVCLRELREAGERIDNESSKSWDLLGDVLYDMDAEGLTFTRLVRRLEDTRGATDAEKKRLTSVLGQASGQEGDALLESASDIWYKNRTPSVVEFLENVNIELTQVMKRPEVLRYISKLQTHLASQPTFPDGRPIVGKTSSVVDAVKKANYELNYVEGKPEQNRSFNSVPESGKGIAEVYEQFGQMKKKDSLFHLVTRDSQSANIWVQLRSGDNVNMEAVDAAVKSYMASHEPPVALEVEWAGLTYLNVVWQDKMVRGMFSALASGFVVVLIMMIVLFRSPLYGILSMIPLTVTILFSYGLIGIVGKDYDMPVAVLSSLTLGLSVDFAIHFLERVREEQRKLGSWQAACKQMFKEPAMAISRNAITISIGFTPLLLAPLIPYKTVGFFLATIMAVSWLATLFILPACLSLLRKVAFKDQFNCEQ